MRVWKTGERCQVTCQGRTAPGRIVLGSPNGKSLFVEFEAMMTGHVGEAPLSWQENPPGFYSIVDGALFELADPAPEAS